MPKRSPKDVSPANVGPSKSMSAIRLAGVQVHNLQDVDLEIPHGQWLTICGRSGSGKTSLALDTLYAEGQRRYIESFSAYTRQYLNALEKPNAREMTGIPPSIAVTRSNRGLTGRATVGSNTEILDYLREVYSKLASPFCAACQRGVRSDNSVSMAETIESLPEGRRAVIGFSWAGPEEQWPQVAAHLLANGFPRVSRNGAAVDLMQDAGGATKVAEDAIENRELPLVLALEAMEWRSVHNPLITKEVDQPITQAVGPSVHIDSHSLPKRRKASTKKSATRPAARVSTEKSRSKKRTPEKGNASDQNQIVVDIIVDRIVVGRVLRNRLIESLETALSMGGHVFVWIADTEDADRASAELNPRPAPLATHDQQTLVPVPYRCLGQPGWRYHFSTELQCDGCNQTFPWPTPALFSYNSPVGACEQCEGFGSVSQYDFRKILPDRSKTLRTGAVAPWSTPKYLTKWRKMMPNAEAAGLPLDTPVAEFSASQLERLWAGSAAHRFPGLAGFFRWMEERKYKMHYRIFMARWRSYFTCPGCQGQRLHERARQFRIQGYSLPDACAMRLTELQSWLKSLPLTDEQAAAVRTVMPQVLHRLQYLIDVGMPYVTLDRTLRTLSGGELQRTALTTALGSALVNLLYVLDEPSVGLHPRDVERLTNAIGRLHQTGNTVITVEHEVSMLSAAERIIEMGPGAGANGGRIVFDGTFQQLQSDKKALTAAFLRQTATAKDRRKPAGWLRLEGAKGNNLKNIDVAFPTGVLCLVTGVSGSGKSSLVRQTLVPALEQHFGTSSEVGLPYTRLHVPAGLAAFSLVDGSPIGRSPRSNPVTYVKAFDPIRKLFAETLEARSRSLTAGSFSFNVAGGRCEKCEGDGRLSIDMQFLPDVSVTCPECHGKRYQPSVLEVTVAGKNIDEVLQMTVREAFTFFRNQPAIQHRLKPLLDVGLDYLPLGQGAPTLSAGESQRLKLAAFLAGSKQKPTLFVMDEPTTGLHPADIDVLVECFQALLGVGHSLLIVEHNTQLMQAADYLIDIGPEAGDEGGQVVACGPPEIVAGEPASRTGPFLRTASAAGV